jgi:hypothetical protein
VWAIGVMDEWSRSEEVPSDELGIYDSEVEMKTQSPDPYTTSQPKNDCSLSKHSRSTCRAPICSDEIFRTEISLEIDRGFAFNEASCPCLFLAHERRRTRSPPLTPCKASGNCASVNIRCRIADATISVPYLVLKTAEGPIVPWVPSQSDLLAFDWDTL